VPSVASHHAVQTKRGLGPLLLVEHAFGRSPRLRHLPSNDGGLLRFGFDRRFSPFGLTTRWCFALGDRAVSNGLLHVLLVVQIDDLGLSCPRAHDRRANEQRRCQYTNSGNALTQHPSSLSALGNETQRLDDFS